MTDATDWDDQTGSDADDSEDIIELTEIVSRESEEDSEPGLDLDGLDFDLNETEETGDRSPEHAPEDGPEPEYEPEADLMDDDVFTLDVPADMENDLSETDRGPENIDISDDRIDAALERVIEKKFSERIESILFEVMERVIEKEIQEIKDSLQKDLDDIGKV